MGVSLVAAVARACAAVRRLAAPGDGLASTRLMLHLLGGRRLKTASHPQTEHLAQFLSLAGLESLPELRQWEPWRGRRWRRGGTRRLKLSDMEYLRVAWCGVPGTTAPVAATLL